MSEVALTADDLVIIGRGRILETTTVAAFVAEHSTHSIRVATPEPDKLHAVFETAPQVTVREVPRNANDPQQGRVFRIEGAALEPTARAFAQAQYETRAIPGQVPANTASLPQPTLSRTRRRCRDGAASYPAVASARAVARRGETGVPQPRGHAAGCRRVEDSIDRPAGVQEIRHQMTPIRPYRRALGHSRAIWPLPHSRRTPRNIVRM